MLLALSGRGQGCCSTPRSAQDGPHRVIWVGGAERPGWAQATATACEDDDTCSRRAEGPEDTPELTPVGPPMGARGARGPT